MKRITTITLYLFIAALVFSCQKEDTSSGTGKLALSVTDSPIDASNVKAVYVTFTGLEYQNSAGNWTTASEFTTPQIVNLLDLQNGKSSLLGEYSLSSGIYTGLRFKLDAPTRGANTPTNPGCYVELTTGEKKPLYVPSGSQSGYKAIGNFTVPINGTVSVTSDFDLRKSIILTGSGSTYILNPTIKIIVNNQAGEIKGTISNLLNTSKYVVYVYEKDKYTTSESNEPSGENVRFPGATTSTKVDLTGNFQFSFLAAGTYELIVVSENSSGIPTVEKIITGVLVESKKSTLVSSSL
ncbi:DUF4382 domain-containing protein [Aquirufa antheringensis]|uniref:DUF4382 domain-containing protein n=1 Tax=Aquirufa antheringensis TaxID=2516559 RepID=UPI001032AC59|nr:DUF4382 domain-containing protein [Aquirufa antheringensis]TBH72684.1 DUF4382 domain-containing protein [Aquirufa antheringensis]